MPQCTPPPLPVVLVSHQRMLPCVLSPLPRDRSRLHLIPFLTPLEGPAPPGISPGS